MEIIKVTKHPENFLQQLNILWTDGALCDTHLKTEDGQVLAHRLALMAASPYFASKLSSQLSNEVEVIHFNEVSTRVLKAVVHFIYSGELVVNCGDEEKVFNFCEQLQLTSVLDAYRKGLGHNTAATQDDCSADNKEENCPKHIDHHSKETKQEACEHPRKKPVKRTRKKLQGEILDTTDKTPQKRKRLGGIRNEEKLETIKKTAGCKRKQLKPKKVSRAAAKESIPVVDSKTKNRKVKAIRSKSKTLAADSQEVSENKQSDNIDADHVKGDKDDDGADTDSETGLLIIQIEDKEENDDTSDSKGKAAKPIKRRKRKLGEGKTGATKRVCKRRRKPYPCQLCDKVLSSHKRLVFHQFSKHGSPYDEEKYSMVPCKEEVSILNVNDVLKSLKFN